MENNDAIFKMTKKKKNQRKGSSAAEVAASGIKGGDCQAGEVKQTE